MEAINLFADFLTFCCPVALLVIAAIFHELKKLAIGDQIACCFKLWYTNNTQKQLAIGHGLKNKTNTCLKIHFLTSCLVEDQTPDPSGRG